MTELPLPTTPRERIARAFSPDLLARVGRTIVDLLAGHLAHTESGTGPVLNWHPPEENISAARAELQRSPESQPDFEELALRCEEIVLEMLARGNNLHHPHYIGHQVPASVPLAGLFDAVGSVTNQVMAIYEMGPWATSVEVALIDAVGEQLGFTPGGFAGLVTHGGSLANLTAQLTARNVALNHVWREGIHAERTAPVMLAHAAAHYSVVRTAGILGLGTEQVLRVGLDTRGRMRPDVLDRLLGECRDAGRPVISVTACACATPLGSFDPLPEIADVCESHGVWLHVDAAHGGAACFSDRYRGLLDGLHRADSVVCDAHKMMFVPALCAFVFYKHKAHRYAAFEQDAPYLFDPSAPGIAEFDSGLTTLECTKRAATFGLWGLWNAFGKSLFADLVDVTFSMGRTFYEKLRDADDFVPLHEPECNIVAFRHVPEAMRSADARTLGDFQRSIRRRLIESGEFYIVQTTVDSVGALRVTIINPLTTADDLDRLLATLRRIGRDALGA